MICQRYKKTFKLNHVVYTCGLESKIDTMTRTGIDKVWLHTTNYSVKDADILTTRMERVKEGEEDAYLKQNQIYTDKRGQVICGNSFLNIDEFSLDISKYGLKLNFNPSTLLHPFELATMDELPKAEEIVLEALFRYGIELDINQCKLARLDLTKQAETRQPCSNYEKVFKYLRMPRYNNKLSYDTGFQYGNNSSEKQIVFYDKREELFYKSGIKIDNNFTRCETRYKKKAGQKLGISFYGQLSNAKQESLDFIFNRDIQKLLSHPNGTQLIIDFQDETEYLTALKNEYPKGYINKWLMGSGAIAKMEQFGTRKNLENFLRRTLEEKHAMKEARNIEEMAILESHRIKGNYTSIDEHLKELRKCFL